jgi:phenylalanyl-tRNA synthetase beta chain
VDVVAHNRRHGRDDVRVYEIGARFSAAGESRGVGAAWTGRAAGLDWSQPARGLDFFDMKGVVERLADALEIGVRFERTREAFLVPGQAARIVCSAGPREGTTLGIVGQVSPAIADARGLPRHDHVFVAELDLDLAAEARLVHSDATRPLPRYPFVVRDLSIVVSDALPASTISGTIQAAARNAPAPLVAIDFFDRYRGKGVPDGSVSLSVRLTFQSPDRTLTDEDVQRAFDTILNALVREHGATQR